MLQLFKRVVPELTVGECAAGHRQENRHKSRDIMLQPRMYQSVVFCLLILCSYCSDFWWPLLWLWSCCYIYLFNVVVMFCLAERARPHLLTFDMSEHSDFINAVFVNVSKSLLKLFVVVILSWSLFSKTCIVYFVWL